MRDGIHPEHRTVTFRGTTGRVERLCQRHGSAGPTPVQEQAAPVPPLPVTLDGGVRWMPQRLRGAAGGGLRP